MSQALGEIPLTIKIRTGITNKDPIAHKLMPRLQTEWGIQGITVRFTPSRTPSRIDETESRLLERRCTEDRVNNVTRI